MKEGCESIRLVAGGYFTIEAAEPDPGIVLESPRLKALLNLFGQSGEFRAPRRRDAKRKGVARRQLDSKVSRLCVFARDLPA